MKNPEINKKKLKLMLKEQQRVFIQKTNININFSKMTEP